MPKTECAGGPRRLPGNSAARVPYRIPYWRSFPGRGDRGGKGTEIRGVKQHEGGNYSF